MWKRGLGSPPVMRFLPNELYKIDHLTRLLKGVQGRSNSKTKYVEQEDVVKILRLFGEVSTFFKKMMNHEYGYKVRGNTVYQEARQIAVDKLTEAIELLSVIAKLELRHKIPAKGLQFYPLERL